MDARLKEMLNVRNAQDSGNFQVRPSWSEAPTTEPTPAGGSGAGTSLHPRQDAKQEAKK